MAKSKVGFLQISNVDINATSVSATFNSDSISTKDKNAVFNMGQYVVKGTTFGDATLTLTPEHSFDNTNFYPITDSGTKVLNSSTTSCTLDFVTIMPYIRLAVTHTGTAHPEMTIGYSIAEAPVSIHRALSAGAVVGTTGTFSGAISGATTLAITGASTLTGAVSCGSTLGVTGNVAVNTDKFTITASSGNTLVGGTFTSTGAATFSAAMINTPSARSGAGAVALTSGVCRLTSTGVGDALTLADGVAGQEMEIIHEVDGGSAVLTPTTKTGFSTITFTNVGDSCRLRFLATRGWMLVSLNGAVAA